MMTAPCLRIKLEASPTAFETNSGAGVYCTSDEAPPHDENESCCPVVALDYSREPVRAITDLMRTNMAFRQGTFRDLGGYKPLLGSGANCGAGKTGKSHIGPFGSIRFVRPPGRPPSLWGRAFHKDGSLLGFLNYYFGHGAAYVLKVCRGDLNARGELLLWKRLLSLSGGVGREDEVVSLTSCMTCTTSAHHQTFRPLEQDSWRIQTKCVAEPPQRDLPGWKCSRGQPSQPIYAQPRRAAEFRWTHFEI